MPRVVAVVSSARRGGNCRDIAEAMLLSLRGRGVETELIHTFDLEISPCEGCEYECFEEGGVCPIDDDVPLVWGKMREADGIVLVVPSYYGLPPAVLKAVIERAQGILGWVTEELRDLDGVWKGKPVVVAVVADGGGEAIVGYFEGLMRSADLVSERFSYSELGRPGFKGGLIELPAVSERVEELAEAMHRKLSKKLQERHTGR